MKAVNAYYRKHKTLDGCPHIPASIIESLKSGADNRLHTAPDRGKSLLTAKADAGDFEPVSEESSPEEPDEDNGMCMG